MQRNRQTMRGSQRLSGRLLKSAATQAANHLEALEDRKYFAVTASFLPTSGSLTVFGDALDNNIVVSRDAAGKILVNGGAVTVLGGTPTVANTSLISVFGLAAMVNPLFVALDDWVLRRACADA